MRNSLTFGLVLSTVLGGCAVNDTRTVFYFERLEIVTLPPGEDGAANPSGGESVAAGAAAGGLLGAAGSTNQMGMMYTIDTGSGSVKVVTDQTEIHMGDCVVVETANDRANVRRVNREVCDPAAADVVKELEEEFVEEAAECASARTELAAAKTDDEFDRALMKVDILCNN